jgi:hypothetical protein
LQKFLRTGIWRPELYIFLEKISKNESIHEAKILQISKNEKGGVEGGLFCNFGCDNGSIIRTSKENMSQHLTVLSEVKSVRNNLYIHLNHVVENVFASKPETKKKCFFLQKKTDEEM